MRNRIYTSSATIDVRSIQYKQRNIGIIYSSCIERNWAFIDMQNLYKGIQERGWKINWFYFRQYLQREYHVFKAVVFMGYIKENIRLYDCLRNAGFEIEFRQVKRLSNGVIDGGNVDADLASYAMDYKSNYEKAIIVADDGDYFRTIKSLYRQGKLKLIISAHTIKNTSGFIKNEIERDLILSIH
ncbi:MAG: NYN domain-containing protein, partial [Bacteroidia bacterium]|nr:NYN domain-containing protein [Bacteroidia bacterium]